MYAWIKNLRHSLWNNDLITVTALFPVHCFPSHIKITTF